RVITPSRWNSWMAQLPNRQERIAFGMVAAAAAIVIAGLSFGLFLMNGPAPLMAFFGESEPSRGAGASVIHTVIIGAVILAGVACLLTESHKRLGVIAMILAALLMSSGCSKAPEPPQAAQEHPVRTQEEVNASIREATRYRDPRAGFKPKPIAAPGAMEPQESNNAGRE
ncbi:hypothetical protein M3O56_18725, partial [Xanthomonas nasturtii]